MYNSAYTLNKLIINPEAFIMAGSIFGLKLEIQAKLTKAENALESAAESITKWQALEGTIEQKLFNSTLRGLISARDNAVLEVSSYRNQLDEINEQIEKV